MVEGILSDIDRPRYDAATTDDEDARHPVPPPPDRRPSPRTSGGSPNRRRRNPGLVMLRALKRLWIPLVILVVIGAGGLTVTRLHGVFGSENHLSYADTSTTDEAKPLNSKRIRYEVFGPPGAVAGISYFDENGDLQRLKGIPLPWSLEFAITPATAGGNVVAQGDLDTIGCRILVDGELKAEKITNAVSAFTFCRLKNDE